MMNIIVIVHRIHSRAYSPNKPRYTVLYQQSTRQHSKHRDPSVSRTISSFHLTHFPRRENLVTQPIRPTHTPMKSRRKHRGTQTHPRPKRASINTSNVIVDPKAMEAITEFEMQTVGIVQTSSRLEKATIPRIHWNSTNTRNTIAQGNHRSGAKSRGREGGGGGEKEGRRGKKRGQEGSSSESPLCFLTSGKIRDVVTSPACNSVIVTCDRRAPLPLFPVLKPRNQPRKLSVQRERSWPGLVHDWITGGNKMRFNESSPLHSTRRGSSSSSSSIVSSRPSFFFLFFLSLPLYARFELCSLIQKIRAR